MILTDSHVHLYLEQFEDDISEVIQKANKAGVKRFFLPNIDSSTVDPMFSLVKSYPDQCFPMMGLHPTSVKEDYEAELEIVEDWLKKDKFYAVGETGMDLYWDKSFQIQQEAAFRKQIELAKQLDLPIVIHCREAFDEIFEVLEDMNDDRLRGIFHCFTGTKEQAHRILAYGDFFLGIGGVVTFKNAGLDKVLQQIDLEHIVLETDAPYLAPAPYRGKRNESAYLAIVAEKVAELKGIGIGEVADITTKNTETIFGI